jgi:hypothetical protein
LITGSAIPSPPNTSYWTIIVTVLKAQRGGSIVDIVRTPIDDWEIDFRELAEWFGLELSRMIVDHALDKAKRA